MGAPTAATKKRRRATKAATVHAPEVEITDEEVARLEAQIAEDQRAPESPVGPDGAIRPVEVGWAGIAGPAMAHIFSIEGKKYFIPERPSPAIMLRFMREVRDPRVGRDAAVDNAMMALLGKPALDALCEYPQTTDEDVANVFIIVGHIMFGAVKRWRAAADPS